MSDGDIVAAIAVLVSSGLVIGGALHFRGGDAETRARRAGWLRARVRPLALLVSGGVMALVGVGMVAHAARVEVEPVDLAALERGEGEAGDYVELRGFARPAHRLCRRDRRGGESCYTPVTSSSDGVVVAALLAADAPAGPGRWEGFTTESDRLDFSRRLEGRGLTFADAGFRLIPESKAARGRAGSWVSLAGLGLLLLGWVWMRRTARLLGGAP